MRVGVARAVGVLVLVGFAATASAQLGHPLKGSWSGDWGPTKQNRTRVLLDLNWDGKAVTGAINPGPNAIVLQKADLDTATWAVHLEADGKDAKGTVVRYVIDGKLENLGSQYRTITGIWRQGTAKGDFKVTRN